MNELIAVTPREIGGITVMTSEGRDLYAYLDVGKDFSTWIKDRIEQYGFVEGTDFATYLLPNFGEKGQGRPTKEYTLSLGMAKELSMVERNAKGKEARLYYIECERIALSSTQAALPPPHEKAKSSRVSERYREAAAITRDQLKICKLLGVDDGMAKVITAKEVRNATGLDFTPLLTNVTATENPRLTVKELAERIGAGAKSEQVNAALEQLGFQTKKTWLSKGQPRSKWELTEAGKKYGALAPYQAQEHEHSGYRPAWHADVLALVEPLVLTAISDHAAAKKPKRGRISYAPQAPEPQGALL